LTLAIKAFAKINPYLAVGALRQDGYHDIDTIFQAVALHDVVTITPAATTEVTCSIPELGGEANLAHKALRLCSEIFEFPAINIHVEKHIPAQAGLGGGSSDAAATILLLNRLASGALSPYLHEVSLACGSDVPFFVGQSARAHARGRGERLEPLPSEPAADMVLAMPRAVRCSTAEAFARLDALPLRGDDRPEDMPYNDFERVAPVESLELIRRIASLGAAPVGLCGSGSAVYAFTSRSDEMATTLISEGNWAVATKTIERFGDLWTQ